MNANLFLYIRRVHSGGGFAGHVPDDGPLHVESIVAGAGGGVRRTPGTEGAAVTCGLAAAQFIQTMSKTTDASRLQTLSQGLAAVLSQESIERRRQRVASLTGAVGLGTSPVSLSLMLVVLAKVPSPAPLPPQMLVNLLRHPLCISKSRRVVLDALGTRYQRTFADHWDFVRYAETQKLGLDLIAPSRRF